MIEADAYIIIEKSLIENYKRPSAEYLEATCKTLSASLFLRSGPFEENKNPIKLRVFDGANGEFDFEHQAFASMSFFVPKEEN